mgnify:CR=1 FL=1
MTIHQAKAIGHRHLWGSARTRPAAAPHTLQAVCGMATAKRDVVHVGVLLVCWRYDRILATLQRPLTSIP